MKMHIGFPKSLDYGINNWFSSMLNCNNVYLVHGIQQPIPKLSVYESLISTNLWIFDKKKITKNKFGFVVLELVVGSGEQDIFHE